MKHEKSYYMLPKDGDMKPLVVKKRIRDISQKKLHKIAHAAHAKGETVQELQTPGGGVVDTEKYYGAIDYLDRLINPETYRDEEGKLRNRNNGRLCWDTYHNHHAKGDMGRSLPPEAWPAWARKP
jgi:hypothetical protein